MATITVNQATIDAMKTYTESTNAKMLLELEKAGLLKGSIDEATRLLSKIDIEVGDKVATVGNAKKTSKGKGKEASKDTKKARSKSGNQVWKADPETKELVVAAVKKAKDDDGETIGILKMYGVQWNALSADDKEVWNDKAKVVNEQTASSSGDSD